MLMDVVQKPKLKYYELLDACPQIIDQITDR